MIICVPVHHLLLLVVDLRPPLATIRPEFPTFPRNENRWRLVLPKDQQSPTPSSLSSEKDFPFVSKSRSASSSVGSISVWDSGSPKRRLANSPWGSPRAGISVATTPPMANTFGSPSSLYSQRQRQEEEDLRLAIQLSLRRRAGSPKNNFKVPCLCRTYD